MIVCLEGIDACGKGTQAALLQKRLNAKLWKFPNKETATGKLIYSHLEGNWRTCVGFDACCTDSAHSKNTDALVFQALQLANRMEVASDIFRAAGRGDVVFDRYWPSGYVYGRSDGLDGEYLINLHRWLPQPDLCILLDIDADTSAARRPERRDRYEVDHEYMAKASELYKELWASKAGPQWVVVNARGSVEETSHAINAAVARNREYDNNC